MSTPLPRLPDSDSLVTAVGLAWGWLEQGQAEQALVLVRGCLQCWPEQAVLELLERQCLVCLNQPVPSVRHLDLNQVPPSWRALTQRLLVRQRLNQAVSNRVEHTAPRQRPRPKPATD